MKKLIIANWKLNPKSKTEAKKLISATKPNKKSDVLICPPPLLSPLVPAKLNCAQSVFEEESGTYLGQTSVLHLKDAGIKYALVGHSASRALHVTSPRIKLRNSILIKHKLTPVYCVGSTLAVNDSPAVMLKKITKQIIEECETVSLGKMILAIEPGYAISTGPKDHKTHSAALSKMNGLLELIREDFGFKKVLYGGSVDPDHAKEYLKTYDGLLVGRASLDPKTIKKIL